MAKKNDLKLQASAHYNDLKRLIKEYDELQRKTRWGDSEVDRVWQGLIYGATLDIPVKVPTDYKGWKMWEDDTSEEFLTGVVKNVNDILEIVYAYRYWGLNPTEKMAEMLKKELWRFVD